MTNKRLAHVLLGIASLVTALVLLVGFPLLLVAFAGWPLPTSIPSLGALEQAARSGIDDQVVVNTLAVVAWLAWAQLTLAFLVETAKVARGRHAPALPIIPGFRTTAARLVAGILMLASTVQPARAFAATVAVPVAHSDDVTVLRANAPVGDPNAGARSPVSTHRMEATAATDARQPTVTAQRYDSFWAIAERTLGDGRRWKEILDLNVGRVLPDGTTITAHDDTPPAGAVLLLPAGSEHSTPNAATPPQTQLLDVLSEPSTVTVEPGDNLWTISEDRVSIDLGRESTDAEVVPYWDEVIDANQDHFVQPGNPNLILPGQTIVLPASGHTPPAPPPGQAAAPTEASEPAPSRPAPEERAHPDQPDQAPGTTPTNAAPVPSPAPPAASEPARIPTERHDTGVAHSSNGASTPIVIVVGGLSSIALAVGLKRLLDRRQRRAAVERDGRPARATPADLRNLHQAVVAQADAERVDDLQCILGWLATSLADVSSSRRPRMIRHSADSLEVLLDHPDPNPPTGWTSSDDGDVWTLDAPPHPDELPDELLSPAPLLVTIGQPEDEAQLYLDLEAESLLALTGDPEVATNIARSIITELALSPLADALRIVAVGDLVDAGVEALERVTVVESWDDIADDVAAWASQSHGELVDNDWPNAFVARAHEPDNDALVPVAVIADQPPPAELTEILLTNLPSAVTIVVAGEFPSAAAIIRCKPDVLSFDTLGIACVPQAVNEVELDEMCRLIAAVGDPDEEPVDDASGGEGRDVANASHATKPDELPSYDILVRCLGNISVEGGKALKPKATSVVAYLALNRSVATERLEEACWFGSDGASHRKRLRDVMTEARDALGAQHLPANRNGAYAAGPRLRTDIELFEWHVQRAAALDPSEAVERYRVALDLVTGRPFAYPNVARGSYGWVDLEHHVTTWEYRVAQAASCCAELQLAAGDLDEAINLLRRLVQAVPLNGTVVEALMRAHIAKGDRVGAERVYQEHAAALSQAELGDPEDSLEELRGTSVGGC